MTKFSRLLVYLFGIGLIVGMIISIIMRYIPEKEVAVIEPLVLPQSNMEPLEVPSQDAYLQQLVQMYRDEGMEAVRNHIEEGYIPGRTLVIKSNHASEPDRAYILLDREVRRVDQQGVSLLDRDPIVARATNDLKVDESVIMLTWLQRRTIEPFSIVTWCVPVR